MRMAEQLDMTVSGVWSRYRRARPPTHHAWAVWQQVLANALDENVAVGVRATVTDNLGRAPTRAELTAARRAAHSLAVLGRARLLHVPGATWTPNTGSQLSGAGEAECDHERHSASRLAVSWRLSILAARELRARPGPRD